MLVTLTVAESREVHPLLSVASNIYSSVSIGNTLASKTVESMIRESGDHANSNGLTPKKVESGVKLTESPKQISLSVRVF